MSVVEKVENRVRTVLHNKLFAMNGYTKLPAALDKTDEIVELVTRAAIAALADSVTDEMVEAMFRAIVEGSSPSSSPRLMPGPETLRRAISAALRAAGEG
jgi:hypothetical protein